MNAKTFASFLSATILWCTASLAQAQVPQYGANVNLEQARVAVAAAVADARRQNLPMAVAVVDTAGLLVAFDRMDNTQTGSVAVAQDKAVSAAIYRRPTKAFQDAVAGGGAGRSTARSSVRSASPAAAPSRTASSPRRVPTP
jgi:hypothetical protein